MAITTNTTEMFDRLILRFRRVEDIYAIDKSTDSLSPKKTIYIHVATCSSYHVRLLDGTVYYIGSRYNVETNKELESYVFKPDTEFSSSGLIARISTGYTKMAFMQILHKLVGITDEVLSSMFLNLKVGEMSARAESENYLSLDIELGSYDRSSFDKLITDFESLGFEVDYKLIPNETTVRLVLELVRK